MAKLALAAEELALSLRDESALRREQLGGGVKPLQA